MTRKSNRWCRLASASSARCSRAFAEFLRVDTDLFQVAATASPPLADREPKPAEIRQWLARLTVAKKDDLLVQLLGKNEGLLVDELLQQVRREGAAEQGTAMAATERRTVAELLQQAEKAAEERRRNAAETAVQERSRRERAAAIA